MTTSPAPQQPSTSGQPLSNERASSIGWYFIESYYDFYNTNIESIHKLYHPNASLAHAGFPNEVAADSASSDKNVIHQATGIEAIKARFTNENLQKKNSNRIVVTSADIQVCLNDKILIVVTGEWSKSGSPFWSFSQTFLLSPGRKENILDLSNDILRFPSVQDYTKRAVKGEEAPAAASNNEVPESAKNAASTEAAKEPVSEAAKTTEPTKQVSEQKAPAPAPAAEASKPAPSAAAASTTPATTASETTEKATETKPVAAAASASAATEGKTAESTSETKAEPDAAASESATTTPSGPAPKLSWAANLASTTTKKPETTSKEGSGSAPDSASTTNPASPVVVANTVSSSATTAAPKPATTSVNGGSKYKKDEWFPIYIRGIREPITEEILKKHLDTKFGLTKFNKINGFIALCDFVDYESQQKALNAKETTLLGLTIQLEVRESKSGNGNGSAGSNGGYTKVGGSKGANAKDKKINGDKRVRDKKQGKKPPAKP